jgi:hypothetical protein
VLELPQDKVEELRMLLDRTTLASLIEASKRIADRLDFLAGLDALIFDIDSKKQTLERRQLLRSCVLVAPWTAWVSERFRRQFRAGVPAADLFQMCGDPPESRVRAGQRCPEF